MALIISFTIKSIDSKLLSYLIMPYCSLRHTNLTSAGVMALARALQHNKSLEEFQ